MLPLRNVKVLDLTTINPFTDLEFADYGAEVIKVERPGSGDTIRDYPPFRDGVSVYHAYTDRGKKSITLNLKSERGKEVLKRLVRDADVLVENFKAGTMEKMGLGYEVLSRYNPALVYGKLSSFGSVGPARDYIAYDIAIQAKTGLMDVTGDPDGEPSRVGAYISDHYSCTCLASAIVMALYHARRTGRGQRVEASMFESVLGAMAEKAAFQDFAPEWASRTGELDPNGCPCCLLPCRDGWAALAVETDGQWAAFCRAFGRPDWAERFQTAGARREGYSEELRPALTALLAPLTRADIEARAAAEGVPCAGVCTMEEAVESPQLRARGMLPTVEDQRLGDILTVGKVVKFGAGTADWFTTAPLLGEHNREIYGAYFGAEELEALAAEGVI